MIAATASQPLQVEGTHNFRSAGGYATSESLIRANGLFRSDALHRLSEVGQRQLAEHGIVRVIDLRDRNELAHAPNAIGGVTTESVHHPIFDADGLPSGFGPTSISEVYRYMVEERTERIVGAVRLIADAPEGGVLVHCTAGKDRTGIVVASALTAVGVSREQVIADYASSGQNLSGEWAEQMLASATERFGELDENTRELMVASPAAAIDETLNLIEDRFGSVEQMLLSNGFDDAALLRLQHRLVA
ncbi:tyrosine-protein phosphatase [Leucobacter sp. UT-8R-CII-1-4]|uniref:tyrosine-protein phosphatase n=1 Tax=Leucobacter sp. UT-8R-CII-1-4 TaxID=3040075 RepID=UPI0024A8755A|nr:tyrosine-protein phosphatase [Leucobacter sp. UT-8R-CII-1-4]MDI6024560.1 tyrosine-protein phosphatase [Leucobacter sp. UT-8R-CII-1-4]